jgi:hypothetical protein
MTSAASLSLDDIAQCCARETEKFNRRQSSDSQFCFELLRRALAEERSEAFTRVYQIYERQVLSWVYGHSRFAQTGESADYFVSLAWSAFYFALRGPKFADFASLPHVLSYLKLCVHTGIAQYLRDQQPGATTPLDDQVEIAHSPDLGTQIDVAELLTQIYRVLPSDRDRLLAHCVFVQDLKPRQIVRAFATHWSTEREVSVDLYRIRRVLRNDPGLRRLIGVDLDEPLDQRRSTLRSED